ncbi:MAG: aminoacyl-tRNA hydrolase [Mycoplasmataceae bacterium]|jgi:PTH1 family peptidyl-tRNA hydrolase|nr:aminoacyl-tRNA hydrolase [Mycoplasmataceae bacterium]
MSVYLIVGLGNYPEQYHKSRHNVGFMVIDKLCKALSIELTNEKFNGKFIKVQVEQNQFIIAKPYTYMNLSGDFVSQIAQYYQIEPHNILIISDDADNNVGTIRIRNNGSSGGQNGIKDIINKLNTTDFPRIKIGIGRPTNKKINLADYVLGTFTNTEKPIINRTIDKATEALIDFMNGMSISELMNRYNIVR